MSVCTAGVCNARAAAMITDATATKASQNILRAFLITPNVLIVQLAKIVKISEKIRIFAAGYAKHIICLHCHATLTIAYVIARKDKVLTWQSV